MKAEFPIILRSISMQPTANPISPNNQGRVETIITLLADGPFYIKRGPSPSTTNFDFLLSDPGDVAIIANWKGDINCFPTPTAGQINVAEGQDHL